MDPVIESTKVNVQEKTLELTRSIEDEMMLSSQQEEIGDKSFESWKNKERDFERRSVWRRESYCEQNLDQ